MKKLVKKTVKKLGKKNPKFTKMTQMAKQMGLSK